MRIDKKGSLHTLDSDIVDLFSKHGINVIRITPKKSKKGNPLWIIEGKWKEEQEKRDFSIEEISEIFGSKKRLKMILMNEFKYTRLMEEGMAASEVYKHLKVLEEHGLIKRERNGYRLTKRGKKIRRILKDMVR